MNEISWKRFGYHAVYDVNICDAVDFAAKHGFGYVVPDLMVPRFFPERFSKAERRRIREFAASKNVSISFHGPADYLNIGSLYPEVRRAVLDRMKLCIDFARDIGAERFTVHVEPPFDFVFAGREGSFLKDHWAVYKKAMMRGLTELTDHAHRGMNLCVENNQLSRITLEVLEELLSNRGLFLTWDLPKSHNMQGEPITEVEDFFRHHIEKVRECHLHDQKPGRYSHDVLGAGKINFAEYLRTLLPRDVHFTLEIRPREKALQSLKTLGGILTSLGWKITKRD
jgi:sugar phosphate isomerase/epimerase